MGGFSPPNRLDHRPGRGKGRPYNAGRIIFSNAISLSYIFHFAAAACPVTKTVFQSLFMLTTVKPYFFAAFSDALSFSP